jgi:hypothetical protein
MSCKIDIDNWRCSEGDSLIGQHKINHYMTLDIPVTLLKAMKDEFYQISIKGNGLMDCPSLKEFYQDITNVLSEVE